MPLAILDFAGDVAQLRPQGVDVVVHVILSGAGDRSIFPLAVPIRNFRVNVRYEAFLIQEMAILHSGHTVRLKFAE